jgi:hypothetical protein
MSDKRSVEAQHGGRRRRRSSSESDYPADAFSAMGVVSPEDARENVRVKIRVQKTAIESAQYELLRKKGFEAKEILRKKIRRMQTRLEALEAEKKELNANIRQNRVRRETERVSGI